jgi:hypothetical protein
MKLLLESFINGALVHLKEASLRKRILSYFPSNPPKVLDIEILKNSLSPTYPDDVKSLYNRLNIKPIKTDVLDDFALNLQLSIGKKNINYMHGHVIYAVARSILSAKNHDKLLYFETGTARGFSLVVASYAASISTSAFFGISLDILQHNKSHFWNCLQDITGKKTRRQLLSRYSKLIENCLFVSGLSKPILEKLDCSSIDLAFIDGAHDYSNVTNELEFIAARQSINSAIIVDDVLSHSFPGIQKALEQFLNHNCYEASYITLSTTRSMALLIKTYE